MSFASRWQSRIEFSRHVRKKKREDRERLKLRKEDSLRLSANVEAHALPLVRLHRVCRRQMRFRRVFASVRSERIRVLRVERQLKVRVLRLNARVLHQGKTLGNEESSAARKISGRRISSASMRLAQIDRRNVLRRAIANAVLANSVDLKAGALVRRDHREETSASVLLAAIVRHVVNLSQILVVTVRRARRSAIAKRASVPASRPNVSNVKARSKDALLAEIVRRAKEGIVVQTLAVVKAAQEAVAHAAVGREAAAHVPADRVQADQGRVDRNQVVREAAEEARDLHFVAISFSDTLIRGTYLFLCRRSPNLYRSA
jgi:hypothetical protein